MVGALTWRSIAPDALEDVLVGYYLGAVRVYRVGCGLLFHRRPARGWKDERQPRSGGACRIVIAISPLPFGVAEPVTNESSGI